MNHSQKINIGAIILVTGFILFLLSVLYSYPIQMSGVQEKTFYQFHPLIWPAITLIILGTFIIGYHSENKIIRGICSSIIPIAFYGYVYFFTYIPSSDCGNVRSMFLVFHQVGIDASYVPYFQYPSYFLVNELSSAIIETNVNGISILYFTTYGVLLGLFLYLFYNHIADGVYKKYSFVFVTIYFVGIYSFLNYQWVPQTLALVYMLILLYLSAICFKSTKREYKYIIIVIFGAFVLSHAFLPVIFIIFFGLLMFRNHSLRDMFIIIASIYAIVLIYFTTYYLPFFIETLKQSLFGFSGEYSARVTDSFQSTEDILSQIISAINRFRVPITWLIIVIGSFFMFIKRNMDPVIFILGFAGGLYLFAGVLFSVMGLRSIQIIIIPLTVGSGYFLTRYKKIALVFIIAILLLVVFGPMRDGYDITQFQIDEEAEACIFLAANSNKNITIDVATNQVDFGFFNNLYRYHTQKIPSACRSGNPFFYEIYNITMKRNGFLIYNPNLGKEILGHGITEDRFSTMQKETLLNNMIFSSKYTYILNGIHGY